MPQADPEPLLEILPPSEEWQIEAPIASDPPVELDWSPSFESGLAVPGPSEPAPFDALDVPAPLEPVDVDYGYDISPPVDDFENGRPEPNVERYKTEEQSSFFSLGRKAQSDASNSFGEVIPAEEVPVEHHPRYAIAFPRLRVTILRIPFTAHPAQHQHQHQFRANQGRPSRVRLL